METIEFFLSLLLVLHQHYIDGVLEINSEMLISKSLYLIYFMAMNLPQVTLSFDYFKSGSQGSKHQKTNKQAPCL